MPLLVLGRARKDRSLQLDHGRAGQYASPDLFQTLDLLFGAIEEQGGRSLETTEPLSIARGPRKLSQLPVQGALEPFAFEMTPQERFVRLHNGVGGHDDPDVTGFAEGQNPLA